MKTTPEFEKSLAAYLADLQAQQKEILDAGIDVPYDQPLPTREGILKDIESWFDSWATEDLDDGLYANNWPITENHDSKQPFGCRVYHDPFDPFGEVCVATLDERVVQYADDINTPICEQALNGKEEAHIVAFDPGKREGDMGYIAINNPGNGFLYKEKFKERTWGDDCLRAAVAKAWGVDDFTLKQARTLSSGSIDLKKDTVTAETFPGNDNLVYKDAFAFAMESEAPCYMSKQDFREIAFLDKDAFSAKYKFSECFSYNYKDFLDIAHGKREVAQAVFEQANGEIPELTYKNLGAQKVAEICAGMNIADNNEILEYIGAIPFSPYSKIELDTYYAHGADTFVAYTPPTTNPLGELDLDCLVDIGSEDIGDRLYLTGTLDLRPFIDLGCAKPFELDNDTRLRFVSTNENTKLPECAALFNASARLYENARPQIDLVDSKGEVLQSTPRGVYRQKKSQSPSIGTVNKKHTIADVAKKARERAAGQGGEGGTNLNHGGPKR